MGRRSVVLVGLLDAFPKNKPEGVLDACDV
jgi:hypothetical protein